MSTAQDAVSMAAALSEARSALDFDEVPVGAVIALASGEIIAAARNERETKRDATAHAEILAIARAGQALGTWRLTGTTLYVTLEPCPMCAGALVQARISRLVYGASDPKAGAVRSLYRIADDPRLNHRVEIEGGLQAEACGALLKAFFQDKRSRA